MQKARELGEKLKRNLHDTFPIALPNKTFDTIDSTTHVASVTNSATPVVDDMFTICKLLLRARQQGSSRLAQVPMLTSHVTPHITPGFTNWFRESFNDATLL